MASTTIWLVYVGIVLFLLVAATGLVKSLEDPLDRNKIVTAVSVFGSFITLSCCFLIPADVYSLSLDDAATLSKAIKMMYYAFFFIMVLLTFVMIPFAYFYNDAEGNHSSTASRVIHATKFTMITMYSALFLVAIGLVVELGSKGAQSTSEWLRPLLDAQADGEVAFKLLIGTLIALGMLLWVYVTARGLAVAAVTMFVESDTWKQAARREWLLDPADPNKESLLAQSYRKETVSAEAPPPVRRCSRFFRYPLGILFIVMSMGIVVSVLITSIDKLMNGQYEHGYLVNRPSWNTPIDRLLSALNTTFPLDYVIFGLIALYVICASLAAIIKYGNRWLFVYVYPVRYLQSCPRALLLTTLNIIFISLILMMNVVTMAPQYATFGNQKFINPATNLSEPCAVVQVNVTIVEPEDCQMSQIGIFLYTTTAEIPLLGVAILLGDWIFVAAFFFWTYWYVHWEEDISYNVRRRYHRNLVDV